MELKLESTAQIIDDLESNQLDLKSEVNMYKLMHQTKENELDRIQSQIDGYLDLQIQVEDQKEDLDNLKRLLENEQDANRLLEGFFLFSLN
jgi:hypothetical protein